MKIKLYCLAIVLPVLCGFNAQAQTIWPLASSYGPDVFQTQNLLLFARDVAAATGNQLKIMVEPHNPQTKRAPIVDDLISNTLPAGEVIMSSLTKETPAAGIDSVPFVARGYDEARILWRHQKPVIQAALAKRGLIVLYACPWPPQGLFTQKPIKHVNDLKGFKMRAYNSATTKIAELAGATPVDIPFSQVAAAYAEGRIDSMVTSAVTGVDGKVWGHAKYFYDIKAWLPKNVVLINKARWDALDSKTQAAVQTAAKSAETRGWAMSQEAAQKAMAELARHGVKIEKPSPELLRDLDRFGERFSKEWLKGAGKDTDNILIPYFSSKEL
jgi:TRAP-type transport system periplasmic protein